MLEQPSLPARSHSESEWWNRLASFATETAAEQATQVQPKEKAPNSTEGNSRGRGFLINVWRPLFQSILSSGPRLLGAVIRREGNASLQGGRVTQM